MGSRAEIRQTIHKGKLAFLVTTDREVDICCLLSEEMNQQNRLASLKLARQSEAEKRFSTGIEPLNGSLPSASHCAIARQNAYQEAQNESEDDAFS